MELQTIEIDPTPASVAAMLERGQFHSHQDGRWRYSPYGGETVYCNDPTAQFPERGEFSHGWSAAADPASGLYVAIYGDGTRGMRNWDERSFVTLSHLYAPRHEGERAQREWIASAFGRGAAL